MDNIQSPPISPEVARHIASFIEVDKVGIPERGFFVLRPGTLDTNMAAEVGRALAGMTGSLVLIANQGFSLEAVDEKTLNALGWFRQ
jgi:hypothetical protein